MLRTSRTRRPRHLSVARSDETPCSAGYSMSLDESRTPSIIVRLAREGSTMTVRDEIDRLAVACVLRRQPEQPDTRDAIAIVLRDAHTDELERRVAERVRKLRRRAVVNPRLPHRRPPSPPDRPAPGPGHEPSGADAWRPSPSTGQRSNPTRRPCRPRDDYPYGPPLPSHPRSPQDADDEYYASPSKCPSGWVPAAFEKPQFPLACD